jgi:DNA-binding beta-propeller fold protein YncE
LSTASNQSAQLAVDTSTSPNHIYVDDVTNNRVLGWLDADSFTNGKAADLVIGQPDFLTAGCNTITPFGGLDLCAPEGVAVDAQGNLYVADTSNSRVLEFTTPFAALGECFRASTAALPTSSSAKAT